MYKDSSSEDWCLERKIAMNAILKKDISLKAFELFRLLQKKSVNYEDYVRWDFSYED
jgi:hypothetical protein